MARSAPKPAQRTGPGPIAVAPAFAIGGNAPPLISFPCLKSPGTAGFPSSVQVTPACAMRNAPASGTSSLACQGPVWKGLSRYDQADPVRYDLRDPSGRQGPGGARSGRNRSELARRPAAHQVPLPGPRGRECLVAMGFKALKGPVHVHEGRQHLRCRDEG